MNSQIQFDVAVVVVNVDPSQVGSSPWVRYREELKREGISIQVFDDYKYAFRHDHDAIMLHLVFNWNQPKFFNPAEIMPLLAALSTYRSEHPYCQHVLLYAWERPSPFAFPYWRAGDPILYRTPLYDRSELYPFPASEVWSYEKIWGSACYQTDSPAKYASGFIGSRTRREWRDRVARETARTGIGICTAKRTYSQAEHDKLMSECSIIVCPRGSGIQSRRHWDAWYSGKPVLTDRFCDSAEMIPGVRLRAGEHYLVFDEPEQIPDIVSDWTRPSRAEDLRRIGRNGREAAESYDGCARIITFFRRVIERQERPGLPIRAIC